MALSEDARSLFEYLPADGSKVSGPKIKGDLGWGSAQFRLAKEELRDEGLVAFGRGGRGGSVARAEGKELPEKPTPAQRMAHAREAKHAHSQASRNRKELMDKAYLWGKEQFPNAEKIEVSMYGQPLRPYIVVWNDGVGVTYHPKGSEWDCD